MAIAVSKFCVGVSSGYRAVCLTLVLSEVMACSFESHYLLPKSRQALEIEPPESKVKELCTPNEFFSNADGGVCQRSTIHYQ